MQLNSFNLFIYRTCYQLRQINYHSFVHLSFHTFRWNNSKHFRFLLLSYSNTCAHIIYLTISTNISLKLNISSLSRAQLLAGFHRIQSWKIEKLEKIFFDSCWSPNSHFKIKILKISARWYWERKSKFRQILKQNKTYRIAIEESWVSRVWVFYGKVIISSSTNLSGVFPTTQSQSYFISHDIDTR